MPALWGETMIGGEFLLGWSVGGLSMILFNQLYDSWSAYMKALRESKCKCHQKSLYDYQGNPHIYATEGEE